MPIFEYDCGECGAVTEVLVGVGRGSENIVCSRCGAANLTRRMSAGTVQTAGRVIGSQGGRTCCGKEERCESPPCSGGGDCRR